MPSPYPVRPGRSRRSPNRFAPRGSACQECAHCRRQRHGVRVAVRDPAVPPVRGPALAATDRAAGGGHRHRAPVMGAQVTLKGHGKERSRMQAARSGDFADFGTNPSEAAASGSIHGHRPPRSARRWIPRDSPALPTGLTADFDNLPKHRCSKAFAPIPGRCCDFRPSDSGSEGRGFSPKPQGERACSRIPQPRGSNHPSATRS